MDTTLITGGTGFIGARVARRLREAGHAVVLFDVQPDRQMVQAADVPADVVIERGDVTLLSDLLRVIKAHHVTRIAHTAYVIGPVNQENPPLAIRINCLGTNNVFEAARLEGIQRICWTSSVGVYGQSNGQPAIDEDDPTRPDHLYGATKLFNEHMAENYYREFKIDHIAIRPALVYGPGRKTGSSLYLQNWITEAAVGGHITIPAGDQMDTWSYVEDVAQALTAAVLAPRMPARRMLNTGGDYRSRWEFGACLRRLIPDARIDIEHGASTYRPEHRNGHIAEALGFRPAWSMEEGVKATVNAVRAAAGLALVD